PPRPWASRRGAAATPSPPRRLRRIRARTETADPGNPLRCRRPPPPRNRLSAIGRAPGPRRGDRSRGVTSGSGAGSTAAYREGPIHHPESEVMSIMQDVITNAAELNRAGKPDEAEALLGSLLEEEPSNVVVLHLLGVIHSEQGRPGRAVELIGRAVALRPGVPAFHVNLAEAYRNGGDARRAEGCCRTALRMAPDYPEALG